MLLVTCEERSVNVSYFRNGNKINNIPMPLTLFPLYHPVKFQLELRRGHLRNRNRCPLSPLDFNCQLPTYQTNPTGHQEKSSSNHRTPSIDLQMNIASVIL